MRRWFEAVNQLCRWFALVLLVACVAGSGTCGLVGAYVTYRDAGTNSGTWTFLSFGLGTAVICALCVRTVWREMKEHRRSRRGGWS